MHNIPKTQLGFSMIEILVTLVIIATALLGTAGLQLYAMRVNQGGQFRTQAIFLAADIIERMEANKPAAQNGDYVLGNTTAAPALSTVCTVNPCDSTNLAIYDLNHWSNAIATLLPQPSWQINRTVNGTVSTYDVIVRWTDRSTDKTNHGETFSYTATRVVSN
ncbi:MAG: type IV pilus modification protein PilV [Gallionella sp.]|jgi:type IV pilus assembly protein PilV